MKTAKAKRLDWSRPLPRPLVIPKVMTLRTLADMRALMRRVPAERRKLDTWQHVAAELDCTNQNQPAKFWAEQRLPWTVGLLADHTRYCPVDLPQIGGDPMRSVIAFAMASCSSPDRSPRHKKTARPE
jgi:hypothetical protein